jgi:putative nucleotidyltransferase with HDIG domain
LTVKDHLSAIILSAGFSGRMGRFKPLLPLGATTLAGRVVALYRAAGIQDVCVVAGHQADELQAALAPLGVRCIVNRAYAQGMFSSLTTGVAALASDVRGFFVHPVDVPLVRPSTLAALIAAFGESTAQVCHPCFDGRRGHPPLVSAELAPAILAWSGQGGLRAFWDQGGTTAREVPVADEAILLDMDTDASYRRLVARLEREDVPSADACRVLMTQVAQVPEAVWRHCRAVAAVAEALAAALNRAGAALDLDLARAAGLVHDIAKTQADHAAAGAAMLAALEYPRVAAAVAVHMDLDTAPDRPLDEAQLVFLADKLLEGERLEGLAARKARKLAKYGKDAPARAAITRRFETAGWIAAKVERITGRRLAEVLAERPGRQE